MSLVAGRGPLSKDPAGWFSSPLPDDLVRVEKELGAYFKEQEQAAKKR